MQVLPEDRAEGMQAFCEKESLPTKCYCGNFLIVLWQNKVYRNACCQWIYAMSIVLCRVNLVVLLFLLR